MRAWNMMSMTNLRFTKVCYENHFGSIIVHRVGLFINFFKHTLTLTFASPILLCDSPWNFMPILLLTQDYVDVNDKSILKTIFLAWRIEILPVHLLSKTDKWDYLQSPIIEKKLFLVLTSEKFLEALWSGIGTCSIFCHSFSLSNKVKWSKYVVWGPYWLFLKENAL